MTKKKYHMLLKDVAINLFSSLIMMATLQLFILPYLSKSYSVNKFGEISALYGINSIIFLFLGGTLGSIRLLNQKYDEQDFGILNLISTIIAFFLSLVIFFQYGKNLSSFDIFIYSIVTSIASIRNYVASIFRIQLKFNFILYTNFFYVFGLVSGFFLMSNNIVSWSVIFLLAELFSLVFYSVVSKFYEESLSISNRFKFISKEYCALSLSTLISSGVVNLDKILLIPLLDPKNMAIYFSVSSVSKILNLIINPLSTVSLSYISKSKRNYSKLFALKIQIFGIFFSFILTIPFYFISKIMIFLLYSNIVANVKKLEVLTMTVVLGSLIISINSLINTYFLKYYNMNFQIYIQVVYGFIYIILAYSFSSKYGLVGYASSFFISSLIKYVLQMILILFLKPKEIIQE